MENLFEKNIKNDMTRLFEIASDHDATLKQVLERLEKQETLQTPQNYSSVFKIFEKKTHINLFIL